MVTKPLLLPPNPPAANPSIRPPSSLPTIGSLALLRLATGALTRSTQPSLPLATRPTPLPFTAASPPRPPLPKKLVFLNILLSLPQTTNSHSLPAPRLSLLMSAFLSITPVRGQENFSAPVTVTKTVIVGVDVPQYTPVPNEYTTEAGGGKPQIYTVTVPNGPRSTLSGFKVAPYPIPSSSRPTNPTYPVDPKPSSDSSIVYSSSTLAPYPTSFAGYPIASSSAKPSSSAPAYQPYPVQPSTEVTPTPSGCYGSGYGY